MSFGYWFQAGSKYCWCVCPCVFGCCRGLSQTSICHRTIAHSSKRSAALMWREGAPLLLPLLLLDIVFGPVPSRHRLHCWGTAGGLSVCLPVCTLIQRFNLPPPFIHFNTWSRQPRRRRTSSVSQEVMQRALERYSILWRQRAIIASYPRTMHRRTQGRTRAEQSLRWKEKDLF